MSPARGVLVTIIGIVLIAATVALFYGGGLLSSALLDFQRSGRIGAALGGGIALLLWRVYLRWCGVSLGSFHPNNRKDRTQ
jgi:hypothetical protein